MGEHVLTLLFDAWRAKKHGRDAIASRQQARLAEMVAFARAHSPYYRELYADVPANADSPGLLPITSKKALMARFDDWSTDREVTLQVARNFAARTDLIGQRFLGRYTLLTTSGTTGNPGIFVLDKRTMTVAKIIALRMLVSWLQARDVVRLLIGRGRMSMVMATGGHFASSVAAARLRKRLKKRIQILSVHSPLPELVAALNQFRPVLVAPYASMAVMLASEQEAGRLHINPVLMTPTAEGLPTEDYERVARVFGTKVGNFYAATECLFFSYSCEEGWLHVNADWVIFEPVDANYEPVPRGTQSYTVLISNLANRVQPILRYDLGDSVLERPDSCPCGNRLPAIRVQGRAADVLTFPTASGEKVSIAPLAFTTLMDHTPGIELSQIVQSTPTTLGVRLRLAAGTDASQVYEAVEAELVRLLAQHGLTNVRVERTDEPPQQSAGGKYRTTIPLSG